MLLYYDEANAGKLLTESFGILVFIQSSNYSKNDNNYAECDIIYKVNSLWTGEANGSSRITLSPEGVIDVIVVALAVVLLFQPLRFRISCKRRIILLRTDPVLNGI